MLKRMPTIHSIGFVLAIFFNYRSKHILENCCQCFQLSTKDRIDYSKPKSVRNDTLTSVITLTYQITYKFTDESHSVLSLCCLLIDLVVFIVKSACWWLLRFNRYSEFKAQSSAVQMWQQFNHNVFSFLFNNNNKKM